MDPNRVNLAHFKAYMQKVHSLPTLQNNAGSFGPTVILGQFNDLVTISVGSPLFYCFISIYFVILVPVGA